MTPMYPLYEVSNLEVETPETHLHRRAEEHYENVSCRHSPAPPAWRMHDPKRPAAGNKLQLWQCRVTAAVQRSKAKSDVREGEGRRLNDWWGLEEREELQGTVLGFRLSNLRHLTEGWNTETQLRIVELNATPRTSRGDRQR